MITIEANTLHFYKRAYELIADNIGANERAALRSRFAFDDEYRMFCDGLEDDYEDYMYILADYERVIMVFDGEPMREWATVEEFKEETIAEVRRVYFENDGGDDYGNNPPLSAPVGRVEQNIMECTDPDTGAFDWNAYQYLCDIADYAGCEE